MPLRQVRFDNEIDQCILARRPSSESRGDIVLCLPSHLVSAGKVEWLWVLRIVEQTIGSVLDILIHGRAIWRHNTLPHRHGLEKGEPNPFFEPRREINICPCHKRLELALIRQPSGDRYVEAPNIIGIRQNWFGKPWIGRYVQMERVKAG